MQSTFALFHIIIAILPLFSPYLLAFFLFFFGLHRFHSRARGQDQPRDLTDADWQAAGGEDAEFARQRWEAIHAHLEQAVANTAARRDVRRMARTKKKKKKKKKKKQ